MLQKEQDIKKFKRTCTSGFEYEEKNIAIDFDGVIHNFNKGWHDGVYGKPLKGSLNAIKKLSKKYKIIIFSSKVRSDRPLVNNKSGLQLVDEWLSKHGFSDYISEVTSEKPRANYYVDDKAVKFVNWKNTLEEILD